jgi:hypothetical protein
MRPETRPEELLHHILDQLSAFDAALVPAATPPITTIFFLFFFLFGILLFKVKITYRLQ